MKKNIWLSVVDFFKQRTKKKFEENFWHISPLKVLGLQFNVMTNGTT